MIKATCSYLATVLVTGAHTVERNRPRLWDVLAAHLQMQSHYWWLPSSNHWNAAAAAVLSRVDLLRQIVRDLLDRKFNSVNHLTINICHPHAEVGCMRMYNYIPSTFKGLMLMFTAYTSMGKIYRLKFWNPKKLSIIKISNLLVSAVVVDIPARGTVLLKTMLPTPPLSSSSTVCTCNNVSSILSPRRDILSIT